MTVLEWPLERCGLAAYLRILYGKAPLLTCNGNKTTEQGIHEISIFCREYIFMQKETARKNNISRAGDTNWFLGRSPQKPLELLSRCQNLMR